MEQNTKTGISIQVSLSGYSFQIRRGDAVTSRSPWLAADKVFTCPELQQRYDEVSVSLLTPKVTLVPEVFFDPAAGRAALEDVVRLDPSDTVASLAVPAFAARLVYSLSLGETLSATVARMVPGPEGHAASVLPEMYFLLTELDRIPEYNRILASYADGYLHLVLGQGRNLLLANVFRAPDFTTAEYFLFLSLKKLQLNPEVSSIYFRTPLSEEEELSLYRYFKSVEQL